MDIYTAANFLSGLDLTIPNAIIIDDTVPLLHSADTATREGTYLIQTDYPRDQLTTAIESGVLVYSATEDRAARIHDMTDTEDVELTPDERDRVQQIDSVRINIPIGPYNSIHALIPPEDTDPLITQS